MRYVEYKDGIVFGPRLHWAHVELHALTGRFRHHVISAGFLSHDFEKQGMSIGLNIVSTPGSVEALVRASQCVKIESPMGFKTVLFFSPGIVKDKGEELKQTVVNALSGLCQHPNCTIEDRAMFTTW
jgi:hypothetical protein